MCRYAYNWTIPSDAQLGTLPVVQAIPPASATHLIPKKQKAGKQLKSAPFETASLPDFKDPELLPAPEHSSGCVFGNELETCYRWSKTSQSTHISSSIPFSLKCLATPYPANLNRPTNTLACRPVQQSRNSAWVGCLCGRSNPLVIRGAAASACLGTCRHPHKAARQHTAVFDGHWWPEEAAS